MDVDEIQATIPPQLELVSYFDLSPGHFAWNSTRVYEIQERRSAMSNQLFFDILLSLGGIEEPAELYPPSNIHELRRLLDAIENLSFDSMKRECLIYYLLKWQMDEREKGYADEKYISPHYVALADAYWHLDSGISIGKAVALLSDARIVKEYSSKVIETLSLEDLPSSLILRYVKTCSPALRERNDLQKYIRALADHNFVESWQFQRTYPVNDKTRKFLICEVLTWALDPLPQHEALRQLLSLPMNKFEEDVVREFAIQPPEILRTSATAIIRDLVCVRLIQSCKYIEAVKFDRQYPSSADFAGATTKGTWQTERKRIMEQILSIMPATERAQLDRELEQIAASSSHGSRMSGSGSGGSWTHISSGSTNDVSMSWEDIGNKSSFAGLREESAGPARSTSRAARGKRVSLLNGRIPASGSGVSTPRNQPLSAHPTVLSQVSTVPVSSPGNSMLYPNSLAPLQSSTTYPPLRVPVSSSLANTPNTTINGNTPKTNAFMARNAFFQPPANAESSTPIVNGISRPLTQRNNEANRSLGPNTTQSTILMDEDDAGLEYVPAADTNSTETPQKKDAATAPNDTVDSEHEDLGYSIFGGTAAATRKPVPAAAPLSPRKMRKATRSASTEGHEMPPGAFIEDEPEVHHTRATTRAAAAAAQAKSKETSRRKVSAMKAPRKRASPDDGFTPSIPGGLMDDEEYGFIARHGDGRHSYPEEEEEEDLVPPLPSQQTRSRTRKGKSGAGSASATGRTLKSRRSSSVASTASMATTDTDGEGTGSRMVRRSSRLSNVSSSPPNEKKSVSATGSSRPRKSTRTSGAGATATGRGAAKRR